MTAEGPESRQAPGEGPLPPAGEAAPGGAETLPAPIHVAWVAGQDTLARLGCVYQPLAVGLIDELFGLTVLCPQGADTGDLPVPPVGILPYPPHRWLPVPQKTIARMAKELRSNKVRVLHALEAGFWPLARRLAEAAEARLLVSAYGLQDRQPPTGSPLPGETVLAASDRVQEALSKRRALPPDRIRRVRPGVYQVHHATCFADPSKSVAIVACGGLDDVGAPKAVLKTFAELQRRHYDCVFFLIGRGRAERHLRKLADSLGLRDKLTFCQPMPSSQLWGILKAADICICPAAMGELDIAALLAMAAGTPVLAGGAGAADFLLDRQTASLFSPGNADELTAKLCALLDDRAAARSLAEGALAHLRERHSPARMVSELADIYRRTAAAQEPAGQPSAAA